MRVGLGAFPGSERGISGVVLRILRLWGESWDLRNAGIIWWVVVFARE
jgi:hypothetical protein